MTAKEYTRYLHRQIPLTAAMQLEVVEIGERELRLRAPLAPNRNLHGTAFGGSLATLAIVAGWALLDRRLDGAGIVARLVVQRSEAEFIAPAEGELWARARLEAEDWDHFTAALQRRGRAGLELTIEVESLGVTVQRTRARYAAIGQTPALASEP